ncbi:hypothetical protein PINS_up012763 [Pythium insidiosum]|nr:hypothetical protein PINS_up012763 [Pythium insidiosum]
MKLEASIDVHGDGDGDGGAYSSTESEPFPDDERDAIDRKPQDVDGGSDALKNERDDGSAAAAAVDVIEIEEDGDDDGDGNCARCGLALLPAPAPPVVGGLQCKCCLQVLYEESFSRNQRNNKPVDQIRCLSCCKGGAAVLVELGVDPLVARAERKERAEKHVEKRKRLAASGKVRVTRALASASATETPLLPVSRDEMTREVRDLKLARRSLQRRRETVDLRGSTRAEYEQQLATEASLLDSKEAALRARDARLFEELQQSIKIKRVQGVPAKERDHASRKKLKKATRRGADQSTPAAARTKRRKTSDASAVVPVDAQQSSEQTLATQAEVRGDNDDDEIIVQWF